MWVCQATSNLSPVVLGEGQSISRESKHSQLILMLEWLTSGCR
jgi:hypothetical protein